MAIVTTDSWLMLASSYANIFSGCLKVKVGTVLVRNNKVLALGANKALPNFCATNKGCLRVEKYGDNAKDHRNPGDCRAIHSEIDAIASASTDLTGATAYVTRYPCEACARALIAAGVTKIVYGRESPVTEYTRALFEHYGVEVIHFRRFKEADVTT